MREQRQFTWHVGFATTGKSGWLVQEVVNTYRAQDASGTDLGGVAPTPQYWEAWAVDAASAVTPSAGATNDMWLRPSRGASTQGHWSMRGKVYFTTTDPATQGFDVPLLVVRGYALGGLPEPVTAHVSYFDAHGTLRAAPLAPSRSRPEVTAEFARLWTAAYGNSPPDVAALIDAELARMR